MLYKDNTFPLFGNPDFILQINHFLILIKKYRYSSIYEEIASFFGSIYLVFLILFSLRTRNYIKKLLSVEFSLTNISSIRLQVLFKDPVVNLPGVYSEQVVLHHF